MVVTRRILKLVMTLSTIVFIMDAAVAVGQTSKRSIFHKDHITTISKVVGDRSVVSTEGRPLVMFRIPSSEKKMEHKFLIQGGLHGNEKLTSAFVVWLANRFAKGKSTLNKIKAPFQIDFIPNINPDGAKRNYRYNARNVNLNRNYSVLWGVSKENPGPKPFSEKESLAIKKLMTKEKYTAAFDIHGYINWVVLPSKPLMVQKVGTREALLYYQWQDAVSQEMDYLPRYKTKKAGSLGDGGAFEDFAYWEMGAFSLCLEMATATRFAEINTRIFPKGTDTFQQYEMFLTKMVHHAIKLKSQKPAQLSFSEKKFGNAKAAGNTSAFK